MTVRVGTNLRILGKACLAGAVVLGFVSCGALTSKRTSDASSTTNNSADGNPTQTQCNDAALVSAALTTLDTNCYTCHGAGGASKGGPKDVTDLAGLVSGGLVVPSDTTNSKLMQVVNAGTMPKGKSKLGDADIAALSNWIAAGAPQLQGTELTTVTQACLASQNTGTSTGAGSGTGTGTGTNNGAALASNAQAVLSQFCAGCHDNGNASGGLGTITNLASLVSQSVVTPGNPATSKIISVMNSGVMPPSGHPAPSAAQIQEVAAWISSLPSAPPPQLTPGQVFNLVAADLQAVNANNANDSQFMRYLSLANLVVQTPRLGGTLSDFANGLSRVVNSMSLNPQITPLTPVPGSSGEILRLDLRNYNWSQQNWQDILNIQPDVASESTAVVGYPYAARQLSSGLQTTFQQLANTSLPVVNGDWFAFQVTQPPLYDELLHLKAANQGGKEADLENLLGFNIHNDVVDTFKDQGNPVTTVVRAGFNNSTVALNNRVIERHETAVTNGSYWKSYDFNGVNSAIQNVFQSPLGSARDLGNQSDAKNIAFQEDASEIIFTLPNGLQGYYIVDGKENALDEAATTIAEDKSRPHDLSVITGYGCMNCHTPGILQKNDQIVQASSTGAFSPNQLEEIKFLYAPQATLNQWYTQDTANYIAALKRASIDDPNNTRALVFAGQNYEQDITLADAAAVIGLPPQQFSQALANTNDPTVKQALSPLTATGGTVLRSTFEQVFAQLVNDICGNLGNEQGSVCN